MQIINTERFPIKCWTDGVEFEESARAQVLKVASLPFIYKWVSIMPDVHSGIGCTIGTVLPTIGAIVPAAVGVDIGCGMQAVMTNIEASHLEDNLDNLRCAIEEAIPTGFGGQPDITEAMEIKWNDLHSDFKILCDKYPILMRKNSLRHLGTLGGGNHFIEICLDEHQHVWFMLHSGSRGIGNALGTHFISLAKQDMEKYFITLPDEDLSYFPEETSNFNDYIFAVNWAQKFAKSNRDLMMETLIDTVSKHLGYNVKCLASIIDCHHNYVSKEHHFGKNVFVTRKGAVSAKTNQLGIIPGSMGAKSYIVRGLGNPESFHSCSHGAGRVMSRNAAKKLISVKEHRESLKGVECRKNETTLDESPAAYKNIDHVINAQDDLIEIVATLHQILCVKG